MWELVYLVQNILISIKFGSNKDKKAKKSRVSESLCKLYSYDNFF